MQFLSKVLSGVIATLIFPSISFSAPSSQVVGWAEEAAILPERASVKVEMDTSAEKSSLMAGHIEPFEKNGENWVRFTLQVPQGLTGALVDTPFERRVVRTEKAKGLIGGAGHRQVVKMALCVGKQPYEEELQLKTLGKKDFVVILGRDALQHIGTVDAGRINTVKPTCEATTAS